MNLKWQQAGGKEDGAQGVGLNTDKVKEALEIAQRYLLDGKA
jgi:alanyl-tRNA synthetase